MVRSLQCTLGALLNKGEIRSVAEEVLGEYPAPPEGLLTEMHKVKIFGFAGITGGRSRQETSPEILSEQRWRGLPGPGGLELDGL